VTDDPDALTGSKESELLLYFKLTKKPKTKVVKATQIISSGKFSLLMMPLL